MMTEFGQLNAWYEEHKDGALKGKTFEEIATLATAVGYTRPTVAQWTVSMKFKEAI